MLFCCEMPSLYQWSQISSQDAFIFCSGALATRNFWLLGLWKFHWKTLTSISDNIFGSIPPEAHKHVKPSKLMVWILGQHLYTLLTNKWPSADLDASPPKKFPSRTSKGKNYFRFRCPPTERFDFYLCSLLVTDQDSPSGARTRRWKFAIKIIKVFYASWDDLFKMS